MLRHIKPGVLQMKLLGEGRGAHSKPRSFLSLFWLCFPLGPFTSPLYLHAPLGMAKSVWIAWPLSDLHCSLTSPPRTCLPQWRPHASRANGRLYLPGRIITSTDNVTGHGHQLLLPVGWTPSTSGAKQTFLTVEPLYCRGGKSPRQ